MKRFLCAALACALLAGCGGKTDNETEPSTENTTVTEAYETESTETTEESAAAENTQEQNEPAAKSSNNPVEQTICDKIYDKCIDSGNITGLVKHNEDYIYNYFGIDTNTLEGFAMGEAEDATSADMLIIIKAATDDQTDELYTLINDYKESKLKELENYNPAQYQKVENALVYMRNNYVYFVVSDNDRAVLDIIEGMI